MNTSLYLFNRRQNSLVRYDVSNRQVKEIELPQLTDTNQAHEFFIDPIRQKAYLIRISNTSQFKLYQMENENHSFREIAETELLVRGIFDGRMYVTGTFDGAAAHYLVPLAGRREKVIFYDHD